MVKYGRSITQSKLGVNYVRSTVESAGSLFHKIEQENDLGIDGIIEFVQSGHPVGKQVAVQIKSGESFYHSDLRSCSIPVTNHRDYWTTYSLPVIGVVYVPSLETAHWTDIKRALRTDPHGSTIRFPATGANKLDRDSFENIFTPFWLEQSPTLALPKALALAASDHLDEVYLGLLTLFRKYPNEQMTWRTLVGYFTRADTDRIPITLIYHLAHIPWHGDIVGVGESITPETRVFARGLLSTFTRSEVIKLISMVNQETGIARGTIGQSIEAIVSSLPQFDSMLQSIVVDEGVELVVRDAACLILAMHSPAQTLPLLQQLASAGSPYAIALGRHLRDFGTVNPYL